MKKKEHDFLNYKQEGLFSKPPSPKNSSKKRKLDALISWKIQEFEKGSKSLKFLSYLYLALFLLTLYGLITNNLLLSILIILFGFTFFIFEKKPKKTLLFAVTKEGIFIHDHLYYYDSLKSFWIEYQPEGIKEVSFKSDRVFLPYIKIPLEKTSPLELRKVLLKFLPEESETGILSDFIDRF